MTDQRTIDDQEKVDVPMDDEPIAPAAPSSEEKVDELPTANASIDAAQSASVTDDTESSPAETDGSLLPADQNDRFTTKWQEIQASFVDRPQEAVEEADALVADLMQRVTGGLTGERERLESQWASGEDVSTEDLRVALTRYRTFFDRLLSA